MTTNTRRIRITLDADRARREADALNRSISNVGSTAANAVFSVNNLAAAIAAAVSVASLTEYSDAWTSVQNQLKRTTTSTENLAETTVDLLKVANDTRQGLLATTELYTSLRVSTEKLGYSQSLAVTMTRTINNLMLESGKTAAETAGAMNQLGQALVSGTLRGDEFNSIAEGAPGIMRALQVELKMTQGELREFAATGGITSEALASALSKYADVAQQAADKTTTTFSQSSVVAKNNAIAWVGASDLIKGATAAGGKALVALSENLDAVMAVAGTAAAIMLSRLIPAIMSSAAAMGTLTLASAPWLAIAIAIGGAIAYFATRTSDAEKEMKKLAGTTEQVTEAFKAMSKQEQTESLDTMNESVAELNDKLTIASKKLGELEVAKSRSVVPEDYNNMLKRQVAYIEKLTEESDKLKAKQEALASSFYAGSAPAQQQPAGSIVSLGKLEAPSKFEFTNAEDEIKAEKDKQFEIQKTIEIEHLAAIEKERDENLATLMNQRELESAKYVTKSLQDEAAQRQQAAVFYREIEINDTIGFFEKQQALINQNAAIQKANLSSRIADEEMQIAEQRARVLENEKLTKETKDALDAEYHAQKMALKESRLAEEAQIEADAAQATIDLDKARNKARLDNVGALGDAMMSLGQGQSKKIFKIGQKLALAQAAVALPAAVLQSFQNGGGMPWGLVPAGAMLATGLKNIQQIKSAGSGLGGGGSGGAMPSASIGGSGAGGGVLPTTANSSEPAFKQKQVIDIRGIDKDSLISGAQLADILGRDDNVIVALNGAQIDAQRRGVI